SAQSWTTDRRRVLLGVSGAVASAAGVWGSRPATAKTDDITWAPAWRIREMIASKQVSPVEVTNHFLARIERFNPVLKAFKHVDVEGAREQARRAEQAVMRGEPLGPLHGVPTSVKEHIAVQSMPVMGLGQPDRVA